MQELAYAWRRLRKSPGFTAAALLTLTLGIGANTAIFSVLYAAFFAPYELHEPERLLRVYGADAARQSSTLNFSVPKFELARAQQTVFSAFDAANYTAFTLLGQGEPAQVTGARVTPTFLQTFGARPVLGRFFTSEEEKDPTVAVISETLWRRQFAADPAILGRVLTLSGSTATVVGVAPRLPAFWQADVWLTDPFQLPSIPRAVLQRGVSFLAVVGRLKPELTEAQAAAELAILETRYRGTHPENADAGWRLFPVPLRDDIVGPSRAPLLLLLGAVGLVLLLACANVANLLLVRFTARRREIALRMALGSPRARIVRQFLLESLLVSVLAGVAASALAVIAVPVLAGLTRDFLSFADDIRLHLPVLLATLAVATLSGLLMGAYPASQASRADLVTALREGARGISGGRGQARARSLLVSSQVAVSLLLLVGAALLVSSFARLYRQPTGYRGDGVFVATVTVPSSRYPDAEAQGRFFERVQQALREAPGAAAAALSQAVPLSGNDTRAPYASAEVAVPPLADRPLGLTRSVTPGYFATLGIPIVQGRDFTDGDRPGAPPVAIVSHATARKLFRGGDAVGRRIIMGSRDGGEPMEVVGVVGDVRSVTLAGTPEVEFYRPIQQRNVASMQIVVRTSGDPAAFAGTARAVLKQLDPELALSTPTTLAAVASQSLGQQRLVMRLLGLFALLALALAVVGIYSVVAHGVRQRVTEIGVRMALGARPRDVLALTVGEGMVPVAAGLAVGLGTCLALGRLIEGQLYGVSAFDPATLAATAAGLALVAAVACWLPAREAAALDPHLALKAE
jgi:putative ABC transport system permease protein